MEAVKILECSREGLPGVWGSERSDGDGGNWGGPPRPDNLRIMLLEALRPITDDLGKWVASRAGVGGGRSTDRAERTTEPLVREGPLLRRCVMV
jgi:hypothetical protein